MKRTMIMTLVAAGFAIPAIAVAGGQDKSASANEKSATYSTQSEAFKTADKNADGFISMEEANGTAHSANFASLDTNGDGKLSQREFAYTKEALSPKDQLAGKPGATADGITTSAPTDASVRK
jgi:coenzyme F420-reducing hydrogenase alpha subunit